MRVLPTEVQGVFVVELELIEDERGFFAHTWSEREFRERGLHSTFDRSNVSYNALAGTLRGLHYQVEPHGEVKLVRCTRGAIFDVAVDLRKESPTYRRWASATLDARNHRALFIPEGCAHGFQTLADDTEVLYLMSGSYVPDAARTIAWNDPALAIDWPAASHRIMSPKDLNALPYTP